MEKVVTSIRRIIVFAATERRIYARALKTKLLKDVSYSWLPAKFPPLAMPQPCHYRARTDLSSLLPSHPSTPSLRSSRGGAGVVHCPPSRPLNLVPDVAAAWRSPGLLTLSSLLSKIHTAVGTLHVPRTLVLPYCETGRPITIFSRISAPFHKSHLHRFSHLLVCRHGFRADDRSFRDFESVFENFARSS